MSRRNYKKIALMTLAGIFVFSILSHSATAGVIFFDDFTGDLSQWNIVGNCVIAQIIGSDGNPPPCLLTDDQLNWGCYIISKQTFNYVNRMVEVSADIKQGNAAFPDQRLAYLVMSKNNGTSDSFCTIEVRGSTFPINPNTVRCILFYDDNGVETVENSGYIPIPNGDGWRHAKMKIRSDGIVEFYLDGELKYTSANELIGDYDGQAAVGGGGRRSLYDNVKVEELEEVVVPAIDITLNQPSFTTGDTLIATAHITGGSEAAEIEGKVWALLPDGNNMSTGDPHFVARIPADADINHEVFRHTFSGNEPAGEYAIGGRLECPVTGKDYSVDTQLFTFTP